jgi:mono/diheme cytochrome c family protein
MNARRLLSLSALWVLAAVLLLRAPSAQGTPPARSYGRVVYPSPQQSYYYPSASSYYVPIPTYGASYSGNNQSAETAEAIRELAASVAKLAERMNQQQGPADPALQAALTHPGFAAIRQHCTACHEGSVAGKKGGKFVLLEGDLPVPIEADLRLEAMRRIRSEEPAERMPKGRPALDDQTSAAIIDYLFKTKDLKAEGTPAEPSRRQAPQRRSREEMPRIGKGW